MTQTLKRNLLFQKFRSDKSFQAIPSMIIAQRPKK